MVGESSCLDRKRANNAAAMLGTGTRSRMASSTVHRPSPESSVYPVISASFGSSLSALASSCCSQERTTVPFVHAWYTACGSSIRSSAASISYPSAYAEGYEMLAAEDLIEDPQALYQA